MEKLRVGALPKTERDCLPACEGCFKEAEKGSHCPHPQIKLAGGLNRLKRLVLNEAKGEQSPPAGGGAGFKGFKVMF